MATIISKLDVIINNIDTILGHDIIDIQKQSLITDNNSNNNDKDKDVAQQDEPRITELPNEMSCNLDISTPAEILRILRVCDSQIFNGWHSYPNIYDFLPILNIIIRHLRDILKDSVNNKIILSGCGTSGRLGFIISRSFNKYLVENNYNPCFNYCMAGHDVALLTSQERPEDDPVAGVNDLIAAVGNSSGKVLLIGITCGLSAPYVGGQIEYAMKHNNFISVLMGFNPIKLSRNRPVEKWNGKTFRQNATEFYKTSPKIDNYSDIYSNYKNIVLNPIFGPETVTGSSRMKSGSGTKILLDVICIIGTYLAHSGLYINNDINDNDLNDMIWNLLNDFETIYRNTYSYKYLDSLAKICSITADTVKDSNSKVIYYGNNDILSIISFIDASEMQPTYGTPLKRYRSYFKNGWKYLNNNEGDLSNIDERFQINLNDLNINNLNQNDHIIFIGNVDITPFTKNKAKCKYSHINVTLNDNDDNKNDANDIKYNINLSLNLSSSSMRKMINKNCVQLSSTFNDFCCMFSMKLLLNAVSTSGHVLSGTVLNNRMINVRVANNKLFYRSCGIIQEYGNVNFICAKKCLLIAIYGEKNYKSKQNSPVSEHLSVAIKMDKVVPIAILLAIQISKKNIKIKKKTSKEIRNILDNEPSVRKVLKTFYK